MSDKVCARCMANAVRALSIDAVEKAKSGHPGMPMGMADIAVTLWTRHLRHNPANPKWIGRDRFILSNGHGSMLQYALLHLTGYDLTMDDIKAFRQFGSKTPGHPEYGVVPGVETSTGPLGQGIANAVGMALAEKMLAAEFNRDGFPVIDNRTYVFLGDGCMMEGLSHEACSLAGVWKLNKLIAVYDDNGISIDGNVKGWFADDTRKRFEAYGWNVIGPIDGHDVDAVDEAITQAKKSEEKPTLIIAKTIIGKGSPHLAGTSKCHGAALGEAEIAATRENLGWEYPPFEIPQEIYDAMDAREIGKKREDEYDAMYSAYRRAYPQLASELMRRRMGFPCEEFYETVYEILFKAQQDAESIATRKASQKTLDALAPVVPELFGGSADLTGSNLTAWKGVVPMTADNPLGRHASYGVREFAMAAIGNGIALYGGFIPFSGTFLTFSDYERNAVRMAALMRIRNIFVFTHDSLGVGEDGPTHQPIEHISSLRLIPNLVVWRPADTIETIVAWREAIKRKEGPSALILSRQSIAFTKHVDEDASEKDYSAVINMADDAIAQGGYIAAEAPAGEEKVEIILVASGSELPLVMKAQALLAARNIQARVVSMPSMEVFDAQPSYYRAKVLKLWRPDGAPRLHEESGEFTSERKEKRLTPQVPILAVEAGVTPLWFKYIQGSGDVIGIDTYGMSAPAGVLWKHFGFTVENVLERALQLLGK